MSEHDTHSDIDRSSKEAPVAGKHWAKKHWASLQPVPRKKKN